MPKADSPCLTRTEKDKIASEVLRLFRASEMSRAVRNFHSFVNLFVWPS